MAAAPAWPGGDANIRRALADEGGHLFVHERGYTLHFGGNGTLRGYDIGPFAPRPAMPGSEPGSTPRRRPMSNRFARPTPATLDRYRSEPDALLRAARATYDAHGDAAVTLDLLTQARERQRKVRWARKVLGPAATMPSAGLGTPGGWP